jgi:hypothetical protein
MDTKMLWALAALVPLAGSISAIAQQPAPGYQPPANYQQLQIPGGYQQPPASYPQQPPAGYQAPPPANYQQPSAGYPQQPQAPANYQQPPPANTPQPQSPPAYQQPPSAPAYQQPPTYQQAPAGYQQPPASYHPPQPANYSQQPPVGYPQSPAGYPQQPSANYQQPPASAGYAVPPSLNYPPPQGAGGYPAQPPNYQQQLTSYPQSVNQAPPQSWTEEQIDPHHKHQDARHNHNHIYPDRGTVVRNLPPAANVANFGGQSYWFADGVWFEPRGAAYMVVEPPIGLVVTSLPSFATAVTGSAGLYFYANDTYYRPRPDLGGYEVVNDPIDSAPIGSGGAGNAAAPGSPVLVAPAATSAAVLAVPTAAAAMTAAAAPAANAMFAAPGPMTAAPGALAAPGAAGAAVQWPTRPPQTLSLTPNNGQTSEQQARDRYDCYRAALAQTGFDPLHPKSGTPTAQAMQQESAYDQLRNACLQAHGYTVH